MRPASYWGTLRSIGILAFGLAVPSSGSAAYGQSARELAQRTFPSVVLLVMQDASGQPLSLGSGFVVGDGLIATNLHVIHGASSGQVKLVGQPAIYAVNSLVALDAEADLVLLKVPGIIGPPLKVSRDDGAVGDTVYAIGNPEGLEGTFSEGIVSGIRTVGNEKLLQITAPISPGSSGGPVINGRGEVVGVAVATFSEGQNLNFAIPSSYLASLLGRIGSPRPLSGVREVQASADSFAGVSGAKSTDAVTPVDFKWGDNYFDGAGFSFTFRNQLQVAVRDIRFYAVFFEGDKKHGYKPIDYLEGMTCRDVVIPPSLAKYIERTANLNPLETFRGECVPLMMPEEVRGKASRGEIRVLDFKIVK